MKLILSIVLAISCLGCDASRRSSTELDAVTAKAALLELMRSEASPFEGADAAHFETIELEDKGEGKFGWGAFTIDVTNKTYVANVFSDKAFWIYSGDFVVDRAGRCAAHNLTMKHGTAGPPSNPDAGEGK